MKFAEATQEVEVQRAAEVTTEAGLTPGRRRAAILQEQVSLKINFLKLVIILLLDY